MIKRRILYTFAVLLLGVVLFGCSKKDVKTLPPFDKNKVKEECAVLIIPANVKVNRIDGKKRGWFRTWSTNTKAATLLVPAGERTFIFEYSNSQTGWSAKKLNNTLAMSAGKMYMISVSLNEKTAGNVFSSAFNLATSFVRDDVIDLLPIVSFLPRPNPEGLAYQIDEIEQVAFDQYLLNGDVKIATSTTIVAVLISVLWGIIFLMALHYLFNSLFMGRFRNSYPVAAFIFALGLIVAGIMIINYNLSADLLLYLLASLLIGIGASIRELGDADNKRGLAALEGKSAETTGNISADVTNFVEELSAQKIKNNYEKAVFHFTKAVNASPYNAIYIRDRGLAYYRLEEWDKAIADFNKAVQLKPKNEMFKKNLADAKAGAPNSSGLVKLNKDDYNGALNDFNVAVNIAPHNARYVINRGIAYSGLKDWGKALADFHFAINLSPQNASLFNYRGLAYYGLKDWKNAIADITEAVRLDPKNQTYKENLAGMQTEVTKYTSSQ
ncbi:MAG: tetratricopeptide repeat protein [Treponema sp.]|jgi:Flp pilus assembly protein TadD|nr:tetratricopeptide repeat protein [Treponema sp.]